MTKSKPVYFRADSKRPFNLDNGGLDAASAMFLVTELANLTRPLVQPDTPEWIAWHRAFVDNLRAAIDMVERAAAMPPLTGPPPARVRRGRAVTGPARHGSAPPRTRAAG